jgi:hypothetical protein
MPKPSKSESKQDFLKRCTQDVMGKEGQDQDQAFATCNGMWDAAKNTRSALSLTAPMDLQAPGPEEGKPKAFLITAYTGQLIDLGYYGKLIIDVKGIKAEAKMPILREHLRDRVVGFSKKAWAEGGNFLISGLFSQKTADAQEVLALGEEGFPWQASVGIWPQKVKVLGSDKETAKVNGQEIAGPVEIWSESVVREVSFVSLGADDHTAAIVLSRETDVPVEIERPKTAQEELKMPTTLVILEKEAPELLNEIRVQARNEGRDVHMAEGVAAERARVMEILSADGDPATTRKAIEDGTPAADTFKLLFAAEKSRRSQALTELETSAAPSMGQTQPANPAAADKRPADVVLAEKARELAVKEKIDLAEAQRQVFADPANAALVCQWQPGGVH